MFKKKTEIHAVPTETATGLALKQSLEPITQITKSLKENRKSLIEEEMDIASAFLSQEKAIRIRMDLQGCEKSSVIDTAKMDRMDLP